LIVWPCGDVVIGPLARKRTRFDCAKLAELHGSRAPTGTYLTQVLIFIGYSFGNFDWMGCRMIVSGGRLPRVGSKEAIDSG
jgi:hypothetical protein